MAKTAIDQHRLSTLGVGQALPQHALAPGAGESSTEAQINVSLAYWAALQVGNPDVNSSAIVADAISYLTALKNYLKDPAHNIAPQPR